jgi:hypothetical protein
LVGTITTGGIAGVAGVTTAAGFTAEACLVCANETADKKQKIVSSLILFILDGFCYCYLFFIL